MTKRDLLPLYDGVLKAHHIGSFTKAGYTFDIVRPGYDAQGRRRTGWTQFVHDGVPIFEVKVTGDLSSAIEKFDAKWKEVIEGNEALIPRALASVKKERLRKFMDRVSGESPAPSVTHDGRSGDKNYPS